MLCQTDETARIKLFVDVFTNMLKHLALILETDYLMSDVKDQEVDGGLCTQSFPIWTCPSRKSTRRPWPT